ncbi:MAG: alpha-L-fucosidase C-terminal domain-containing protein [Bacteroidota bacterium]
MKINSEAIYNTRPLAPYREGKVCFTQLKDGTIYAIYLADENEKNIPAEIKIPESVANDKSNFTFLGSNEKLTIEKTGSDLIINIPKTIQKNPPCRDAWVVKIK